MLSALGTCLVRPARPNPLVLAWRGRYELTLAAGASLCVGAIVRYRPAPWTVLLGLYMTVILGLTLAVRRRVVPLAMCVIIPHRVRRACAEARILTRRGKIPVILLTVPTACGERVFVYCRAGTSAEDFHGAREVMRAACWARDVTVGRYRGNACVVVLDVVRSRGPVGAR